jgi:hypothetical protein
MLFQSKLRCVSASTSDVSPGDPDHLAQQLFDSRI